jgi:Ca2+-binding EF-hand superfamily protein
MKRILMLSAFLILIGMPLAAQDGGDEPERERPRRERPGEGQRVDRAAMMARMQLMALVREVDKDRDSMLTKEELGDEDLLKRLDTNGDGKLDIREMMADVEAVTAAIHKQLRAGYEAEFAELDKDEDGKLTAKELGEKYAALLKEAGKDEDGHLTKAEFVEAREKAAAAARAQGMRGMAGRGQMPSAEDLIKELDKNEDGKLSKEEVEGHPLLSRNFDEIDADKDGFITKDEIEKFMESRRAAQPRRGEGQPRRGERRPPPRDDEEF